MKARTIKNTPAHDAFLASLKQSLADHVHLDGVEMLAISCQFVGMLIAAQDQNARSKDCVMEIVARNIEIGNATAIAEIMNTRGSA